MPGWTRFLRSLKTQAYPWQGSRIPRSRRRTTIVVTVFNACEDTSRCLESVKSAGVDAARRVLVIDDCSTDPRIGMLLNAYDSAPGFHVLRNSENIGYTRSINIGVRWSADDDVVLLNSDTLVTTGWLDGLRHTAFSEDRIGTVTPMSDNAGAFSFPRMGVPNPKAAHVGHEEWVHGITAATMNCAAVEVPTGSGFCMFIKRELFAEIGLFDQEAFPRGYGEENDFCLRAIANGWRNVITPRAYVFHARNASFGSERNDLLDAGMAVLRVRYPDYLPMVGEAFRSQPMLALREASARAVQGMEARTSLR